MGESTQVSIILVHYHTPELLLNCIDSIYNETHQSSFEIIVVNNGSQPNFSNELLSKFPDLKWVESGYNAGFSRANNIGIRLATGDAILLLNSDTIIINSAIDKCISKFEHDNALACGIQLLSKDGSEQISGSFFVKGGLNFLLPLPYFGKFIRTIAYAIKAPIPHAKSAVERQEIDWINGAFLMIKKEVVSTVGLMDEDFFLYAEEVEWCWRIGKKGALVIYSNIAITHLEGGSSNDFFGAHAKGYYSLYDKRGFQLMVSNLLRIRKQFGITWFLLILAFYILEIPIFFIGNILTIAFNLDQWKAWITSPFLYLKNIIKLVLLSPKIISGKPYFYKVI